MRGTSSNKQSEIQKEIPSLDHSDWRKLSRAIARVAVLVSALAAVILFCALLFQEHQNSQREFRDIQATSEVLRDHVFSYDIKAVRSVGATLKYRKHVVFVRVEGARNNTLYESTDSNHILDGTIKQEFVLQDSEGHMIGRLLVWQRPADWMKIAFYTIAVSIAMFIVLFVPSYVFVSSYIRLYVVQPLQELSNAIEQTLDSGMPVKTGYSNQTHLGRFANQFNKMQERLVDVQSELRFHSEMSQKQAEILEELLDGSDQAAIYFNSEGKAHYHGSKRSALLSGIPDHPCKDAETFSNEVISKDERLWRIELLQREELSSNECVRFQAELWGPGAMIREVTVSSLNSNDMAIIVRDVSRLRQMEAEAEQVRKIESLGALTSGVAHDMNNIIAVLLGNLELLQSRYPQDRYFQTKISNSILAGRSGAEIVQSLLQFSRQGAELAEVVNIATVLSEVEPLVRSSVNPNIALVFDVDKSLYTMTNRSELSTAILNLVINARDEMPHGGTIVVEVQREKAQSPIDVDDVRISVSDTGPGIDRHIIDKIRDPFFTTKKRGKGTGMGLSLVHSFATRYNGRLVYGNNMKKGAIFSLLFPQVDLSRDKVSVSKSALTSVYEKRSKTGGDVLLVEDEAALMEVLVEVLTLKGLTVHKAENVQKAIAHFEANTPMDIVVTDMTLPDGTGIDVLSELRCRNIETPIILLSGNLNRSIIDEVGVDQFVEIQSKPIPIKKFLSLVFQHMNSTSTEVVAEN